MPECQNLYRNTFAYHTASAVAGAPKQVPLDECVAFLDDSLAAGDKVLVHCMSGTSRRVAAAAGRRARPRSRLRPAPQPQPLGSFFALTPPSLPFPSFLSVPSFAVPRSAPRPLCSRT